MPLRPHAVSFYSAAMGFFFFQPGIAQVHEHAPTSPVILKRRKWVVIKRNAGWCLNTFWKVKGQDLSEREKFPCSESVP